MWANKFRSPPFVFTGASCQYSYCVISFCESAKLSRKAHHGNLTITASIVVILFFIIAAKRSTWNTTSGTWVEFPVITKNTTRHLLRKWLRLTKTHQPASSLFWVILMFFFFFFLQTSCYSNSFLETSAPCLLCRCSSPWTLCPTELHLILKTCSPWRWLSSRNEIIFNCQG